MRAIIAMLYLLTLMSPAYAGGNHYPAPPLPSTSAPQSSVPDDDGTSTAEVLFAIAVIGLIGCGIYTVRTDKQCFTGKPLKSVKGDDGTVMTPKIPANEFVIYRR